MEHHNSSNRETDLTDVFGPLIYRYTRAQAIADGQIVDVTATAKEAGFRHHTVVTAALWQVIETIPDPYPFEDVEGRLWDMMRDCSADAELRNMRYAEEVTLSRRTVELFSSRRK